jgi:hypothetical protein
MANNPLGVIRLHWRTALLPTGFWNKKLGILGARGPVFTFIATVTIIPSCPTAEPHLLADFPRWSEASLPDEIQPAGEVKGAWRLSSDRRLHTRFSLSVAFSPSATLVVFQELLFDSTFRTGAVEFLRTTISPIATFDGCMSGLFCSIE